MRDCMYCGKTLARRKRKGGREREYCNDICRQLAYRARHPEKRYVDRVMRKVRTDQWKEDPHFLPWQEEVEATKQHIQRLQGELLSSEGYMSALRSDLHNRDEEIVRLRGQLAEAQAEIVRLTVLLDGQSKRKR